MELSREDRSFAPAAYVRMLSSCKDAAVPPILNRLRQGTRGKGSSQGENNAIPNDGCRQLLFELDVKLKLSDRQVVYLLRVPRPPDDGRVLGPRVGQDPHTERLRSVAVVFGRFPAREENSMRRS